MAKKGILCCNLIILVSVLSLIVARTAVRASDDTPNIDLPFQVSSDPTEQSNQTETFPSSSSSTKIPVTISSTLIFHAVSPTEDAPLSDSMLQMVGPTVPIKVQKCCEPGQVLQLDEYGSECIAADKEFMIDVFVANRTHYWNYTTSTAKDVYVFARNPCTESKYYLEPDQDANDTFHLLHNSSLYVPYTMDMLSVDDYCVDSIITSSSTLLTTAVICTSTPPPEVFHFFFGTGLIISVICLILLGVYSSWRTDIDCDHKKCLTFFSAAMATSFFFVAISVFFGAHLPNAVNILIAYIVYYLKLNYFTWLTLLCYDTYRCVKLATDNTINRESYLKRYILAAFLTPVIFILINLFDTYNPALPNLYLEFSYSSSFLWALLLFYVPTILSACINMYIMCSIVLPKDKFTGLRELVTYMRSENWKPTPAPENIAQLKNMYRRTYFLCFIMFLFLILDLVIFLLPSSGEQQAQFLIRNVVYCLQGLFVSCIFIRKDCCRKVTENTLDTTEMKPLNTTLTNGETA